MVNKDELMLRRILQMCTPCST